jgi:hypothetical protein
MFIADEPPPADPRPCESTNEMQAETRRVLDELDARLAELGPRTQPDRDGTFEPEECTADGQFVSPAYKRR